MSYIAETAYILLSFLPVSLWNPLSGVQNSETLTVHMVAFQTVSVEQICFMGYSSRQSFKNKLMFQKLAIRVLSHIFFMPVIL
jgi:hypothetical protein